MTATPADGRQAAPFLTPAEFRAILDLAANAEAKVGAVFQAHDMLQRAALLASGTANVGALPAPTGGVEFLGKDSAPAANSPPWAE